MDFLLARTISRGLPQAWEIKCLDFFFKLGLLWSEVKLGFYWQSRKWERLRTSQLAVCAHWAYWLGHRAAAVFSDHWLTLSCSLRLRVDLCFVYYRHRSVLNTSVLSIKSILKICPQDYLSSQIEKSYQGLPGVPVIKSLPSEAGDMGQPLVVDRDPHSWGSWVPAPQLWSSRA